MYYDLCNGSVTVNPQFPCDENVNLTSEVMQESEWPLERVVSTLVPVFFGIIGLAGLLGNALVVLGKNLLCNLVCGSLFVEIRGNKNHSEFLKSMSTF